MRKTLFSELAISSYFALCQQILFLLNAFLTVGREWEGDPKTSNRIKIGWLEPKLWEKHVFFRIGNKFIFCATATNIILVKCVSVCA